MRRFSNSVDSRESYGLAMITCERVGQTAYSLKTIIGTFDKLMATSFPAIVPNLVLYFAVCRGDSDESEFMQSIVPPSGELVAAQPIIIDPWPETGIFEAVITAPNLVFTVPGDYVFRLSGAASDYRVLIERRLVVRGPPAPASDMAPQ